MRFYREDGIWRYKSPYLEVDIDSRKNLVILKESGRTPDLDKVVLTCRTSVSAPTFYLAKPSHGVVCATGFRSVSYDKLDPDWQTSQAENALAPIGR